MAVELLTGAFIFMIAFFMGFTLALVIATRGREE